MQRRKPPQHLARIRVVGVGGGGTTAIDDMISAGVRGVEFLTVDTDVDTLSRWNDRLHICIGEKRTDSRGTHGDVRRGKEAAKGSIEAFRNVLHGSDLVFIVAGLGGGTGTGVAPIIAEVAKQQNALVIGIVTYPFSFEGDKRTAAAEKGVAALKACTDTLIVIPNDRLLQISDGALGFHETYRLAHDIWYQSIQGVSELVNCSGLINVDFADVRAIMAEGGAAVIATGRGHGVDRARKAALQAARSDLLGITIDGAQGVLFNITGGPDMTLLEVKEAAATLTRHTYIGANVIFGAAVDDFLVDEVRITVIATGFGFANAGARLQTVRRSPIRQLEPSLQRLAQLEEQT